MTDYEEFLVPIEIAKELKDKLKSMDYLYKEVQRLNKRVEYWHKKYLTLKNKVSE